MVKKYVKKPTLIVEALEFKDEPSRIEELSNFIDNQPTRITYENPNKPQLILTTVEGGEVRADVGDYVVKVNDGFNVCPSEIFNKLYEEVTIHE